jgi:hypothetical protein
MANIIEKIRKIDKKTMKNNILLGLIVTLGTGFYVYMNKKSPNAIYLEENDTKTSNDIYNDSDSDSDTDGYNSDGDSREGNGVDSDDDVKNNYDGNGIDADESHRLIFEDLKQTLINKLEETDKNNRIELKKLEDDIRAISEKLDKPKLIQSTDSISTVKNEPTVIETKDPSFLDYIFPAKENTTEPQNVKPEEPKALEINQEEPDLVPEELGKPEEPNALEIKPEEPNALEIKPEEPKALEIKIGGGVTFKTSKTVNKSKKNKIKNTNKVLSQLLKKLCHTLKKQ